MQKNEIAAKIMEHLAVCSKHGYSQYAREGIKDKFCEVSVNGKKYKILQGDRDCSSAVIDAWRTAGVPLTCTYTGNMKSGFLATGLFEWKPMTFSARTGDIYLVHNNKRQHTAMCVSPYGSARGDLLAEFSISENGTVHGKSGDQTGNESAIRKYYDAPWDGILHYKGDSAKKTDNEIDKMAADVIAGKYGNGAERKNKLGNFYAAVQNRVNQILARR